MKIYIVLALLCLSGSLFAEDRWAYLNHRNEIRIGWGDQLFESLMWHNPTSIVRTMPTSYSQLYHEDFRYDQHIWFEHKLFGLLLLDFFQLLYQFLSPIFSNQNF